MGNITQERVSKVPQAYDLFERFGTKALQSGNASRFALDEERGEVAGIWTLPEGEQVALRYDPTRELYAEAKAKDGKLIERIKITSLPETPDDLLLTLFGKKELGAILQREPPRHYIQPQEISDIFAMAGNDLQRRGLINRYCPMSAADAEMHCMYSTLPTDSDPDKVFGTYDLSIGDRLLELRGYPTMDAGDGMQVSMAEFDRTQLDNALRIGDAKALNAESLYPNAVLLIERSPEAVSLIVQATVGVKGAKGKLDGKLGEWHYLR